MRLLSIQIDTYLAIGPFGVRLVRRITFVIETRHGFIHLRGEEVIPDPVIADVRV